MEQSRRPDAQTTFDANVRAAQKTVNQNVPFLPHKIGVWRQYDVTPMSESCLIILSQSVVY